MGMSCLSRAAVARELASGTLVEVRSELAVERWFRTVTRSDEHPSRLLAKWLDWLRQTTS